MTYLLKNVDNTTPPQPKGIKGLTICSLSGTYATDGVPCDGRFEYFWDQSLPQDSPVTKKNIWVFKDTGYPAFIAADPTNPPDPNTLELKEHVVASDAFTKDYCLDCPYPADDKGHTQWPVTKVDMNKLNFYPTLAPKTP
jgi:hypothetical protein